MTTLVLVRHGETVGNSSIRYYGRTDLELSDLGRRQMRAARRWLIRHFNGRPFTHVFSSPLRRAAEGARLIAGPVPSIVEIQEFIEVDFGRFEGLTREEIHLRYPEDFARWDRDRLAPGFTYPGGERRTDFTRRIICGIQVMLELIEKSSIGSAGGPALLVAHRGVIQVITQHLANATPVIDLGSIQLLKREASGAPWSPERLDVIEHLAGVV